MSGVRKLPFTPVVLEGDSGSVSESLGRQAWEQGLEGSRHKPFLSPEGPEGMKDGVPSQHLLPTGSHLCPTIPSLGCGATRDTPLPTRP